MLTNLVRLDDPTPGVWVNERLLSPRDHWAQVGAVIPTGFARIARVLHPAGGSTWAEVAAGTGRTVHPLVQWGSIAAGFDGNGRTDTDPSEGSVPEDTLRSVLRHCPGEDDVVHAVWAGWGQWEELPDESALMPGWGGRDYVLFRGPRGPHLTWPGMSAGWHWSQSASLTWPQDRAWCIATEVDWDSTLVAGSSSLVDALLADPDLETFEVGYHDDLSEAGDTVNPRPSWLRT